MLARSESSTNVSGAITPAVHSSFAAPNTGAGIQDFRWHDLRHTWANWHVQNGTPLFALEEIGGWERPEMMRRYAHLSADHLMPYADRLCALRVVETPVMGTISSQVTNEKELAVANSLN